MRTRFYEFQAHSLFSWLMERRTGRQAAALVSWSSRGPGRYGKSRPVAAALTMDQRFIVNICHDDHIPAPGSQSRRGERAVGRPHMGCPMPSHKFQIGETVYVRPAISRNVPGGAYAVTKQLPHNGQEFKYRIKSANEEHERVVRESELTKA
jgi:hypothetical protein